MLVTCVCITANRADFTTQAVECYLAQNYPLRSLLIFDTSDSAPERRYQEYGVLHWHERRRPDDTVGSLRNRANAMADAVFHPDLLAHWDSDDYSAVGRLSDQVKRIEETGKSCTGYHSIRFTDGRQWWMYHGAPHFALGTSLMYRVAWWREHPFAPVNVAEDNAFVEIAWRAGQLIPTDGGDLMFARIHPGNTSKKVVASNWERLP